MAFLALSRREFVTGGTYAGGNSWVWYVVKIASLAGLLLLFLIFFVGGYMHAKRRMKKGLPLLAYHRWFMPQSTRQQYSAQVNPQNNQAYYQSYPMHPYGAPPAYNLETDYVPPYAPPQGGFKFETSQQGWVREQETGVVKHAPPIGPPPRQMRGESLGPQLPGRTASSSGR